MTGFFTRRLRELPKPAPAGPPPTPVRPPQPPGERKKRGTAGGQRPLAERRGGGGRPRGGWPAGGGGGGCARRRPARAGRGEGGLGSEGAKGEEGRAAMAAEGRVGTAPLGARRGGRPGPARRPGTAPRSPAKDLLAEELPEGMEEFAEGPVPGALRFGPRRPPANPPLRRSPPARTPSRWLLPAQHPPSACPMHCPNGPSCLSSPCSVPWKLTAGAPRAAQEPHGAGRAPEAGARRADPISVGEGGGVVGDG